MKLNSDDISQWTISLEDFQPEYTSVKVWSLLQFFQLTGKRTVLIKENLAPIVDLHYCIYSLAGKKNSFSKGVGSIF